MKKNLLIFVYVIIILVINIIVAGFGDKLVNYFNILFLNTSSFINYQLSPFDILYISSFCLLYHLIIYKVLPEESSSSGFLCMLTYRIDKKKTFQRLNKKSFLSIIIIMINIFLLILLIFLIECDFVISQIKIKILFSGFLYVIKYSIFVNIGIAIFNFLSILSKSNKGMILLHSSFLFFLLLDILFSINIITYSANFYYELNYCIILFLFFNAICFICNNFLKKKGDVL